MSSNNEKELNILNNNISLKQIKPLTKENLDKHNYINYLNTSMTKEQRIKKGSNFKNKKESPYI